MFSLVPSTFRSPIEICLSPTFYVVHMADLSQLPSERDITSNQYFEDILVYVHGPTTAETTLVTKLCMIWRPHLLGHPQTIFS